MASPHTILIVDDSGVIRVMFRELLLRRGYRVLTAGDGATALAMVEQHTIDAVFTDLQLPGPSGGLELCQALRAAGEREGRPIPVWLMSGSDRLDHSDEANAAGAVAFLRKPFDPAEVCSRLAEALVAMPRG